MARKSAPNAFEGAGSVIITPDPFLSDNPFWDKGWSGKGIRKMMTYYQVVAIADSALLSAKLVKNATLKVYKGYSHGMALTHADVINADLLAFIRG
jgi:hypothetical protein